MIEYAWKPVLTGLAKNYNVQLPLESSQKVLHFLILQLIYHAVENVLSDYLDNTKPHL